MFNYELFGAYLRRMFKFENHFVGNVVEETNLDKFVFVFRFSLNLNEKLRESERK